MPAITFTQTNFYLSIVHLKNIKKKPYSYTIWVVGIIFSIQLSNHVLLQTIYKNIVRVFVLIEIGLASRVQQK